MTQLNTADDLFIGTTQVVKALQGTNLVWEQHIAPVNTALPIVTGATAPGDVASTTNGSWAPSATSYTYQWQELIAAVWTNISGQTASTYTTTADGTFRVQVTATNAYGSTTANSAQFVIVTGGATPIQWGDTGSAGAGNWPCSGNRGLMVKITAAATLSLTQFNMRLTAGNTGSGDRFKGLVYDDDGTGGNPGTLIGVSSPTGLSVAGAQTLTAACTITVPAGTYWIGYVCDGGNVAGSESDSGGTNVNGTIMLNSGETNYASPSNPAGNWPGSPGPYSNVPALWWDGTF